MNNKPEYIIQNIKSWNNRVLSHYKSDFYDVDGFLKGKISLQQIELKILGDVTGKSILHLQCHFGLDTISLARLGADVTGVDFSDIAIAKAKELTKKTGEKAKFICTDIYSLPDVLNQKFDIVFTTYGTIGWLPDIDKWAKVVAHFLKPKALFVFAEFHPALWMFDDDFNTIKYRYFNSEAIVETEIGTYADTENNIEYKSITWNHGIGEVVNSLINNNIEIKSLQEYDYSPYNCFSNTFEPEPNKFRIKHLQNKIPMVYSVLAQKKE